MSGTLLKYYPKLSVNIFKVKVTRSRKGQTKNFGFGNRDTCFWVNFSSRTRKMTLEHSLNGPNPTYFENRENAEIGRNIVKITFFDLRNTKTWPFYKIFCAILYTYTSDRALSQIFLFFNSIKSSPHFIEDNIFC